MVTVLALIGVAVALFLAAVLATREGPVLADAPPDAADVVLPPGPVQPEDVAAVRFSLAPRGYRMSEVDDVLERLAAELADRDRRLALLEATIEGGAPDSPTAAPAVDVVEAGEQDLPVAPPADAGTGADGPTPSDRRSSSSHGDSTPPDRPPSTALAAGISAGRSDSPPSADRPSSPLAGADVASDAGCPDGPTSGGSDVDDGTAADDRAGAPGRPGAGALGSDAGASSALEPDATPPVAGPPAAPSLSDPSPSDPSLSDPSLSDPSLSDPSPSDPLPSAAASASGPSDPPSSDPSAPVPQWSGPLTAEPAPPVRPATSGPTAWTSRPAGDEPSPVQFDDGARPEPDRA